MTAMFDVEAQPQSSIPYVHIGFSTVVCIKWLCFMVWLPSYPVFYSSV